MTCIYRFKDICETSCYVCFPVQRTRTALSCRFLKRQLKSLIGLIFRWEIIDELTSFVAGRSGPRRARDFLGFEVIHLTHLPKPLMYMEAAERPVNDGSFLLLFLRHASRVPERGPVESPFRTPDEDEAGDVRLGPIAQSKCFLWEGVCKGYWLSQGIW